MVAARLIDYYEKFIGICFKHEEMMQPLQENYKKKEIHILTAALPLAGK